MKRCVECAQIHNGPNQSKFCSHRCRIKHHVTVADSGCWLWPGNRGNGRYGIAIAGPTQKTVMAHRLSYEAFVGPVGDRWVLHKCDVPMCVNPEHLFLGSAAENTADCKTKKRHSHGERHPQAKLTEQQARAVFADSRSSREIAESYGVSKSAVKFIKMRRNWAHIHEAS